jgi:UDP-N-acetylmuramate: L-alanyl-gamma-D-glutamyl-meso-diaminopimelate ligase
VAATTKAVKEQYPNRTLVACLELHTYSSLNAESLKEYEGALNMLIKQLFFIRQMQ